MRRQQKQRKRIQGNLGINSTASTVGNNFKERLYNLKAIFEQIEDQRPPNWKLQIEILNTLFKGDLPALAEHLVLRIKGQIQGKIEPNEIAFWSFLLNNGAKSSFPPSIQQRIMLLVVKTKNLTVLRWLLEDCRFKITECDQENNIINPGLATHPILHIEFHINSEFNNYFFSQLKAHSNFGDTALLLAVQYNHFPLIKWLVEELKVDINETNLIEQAPLLTAVIQDKAEIVKYLIQNHANTSYRTTNDLTIIHCAIELNRSSIISHLASLCQIDENLLDPDGNNLAVFAVLHRHYDIASHLIQNCKLDIKAINNHGMNALFLCISRQKEYAKDSMAWLVDHHQFSLHEPNSAGETPLFFAARINNSTAIEYLIKKIPGELSASGPDGRHVGHYLATHNQYELIASLLKQNRLKLMQKDSDNLTMLDVALMHYPSHIETIKVCLEHARQKPKKSKPEPTISFSSLTYLPVLLRVFKDDTFNELGPWVESGQTPLHMACLYLPNKFAAEVINDLKLASKLDINQLNQHGETALCSIIKESMDETNLLSKKSAWLIKRALWFIRTYQPRITKLDKLKSTLLHLACELDNNDLNFHLVKSCIQKWNLSVTERRTDGLNAIDLTLRKKNISLVPCLFSKLDDDMKDEYFTLFTKEGQDALTSYLISMNIYNPKIVLETKPIEQLDKNPARPLSEDNQELITRESSVNEISVASKSSPLNVSAEKWTPYPKCCQTDSTLKALLINLSEIFKRSSCAQAYIYGSFHYKKPNDLDILLPKITSEAEREAALSFISLLIEDTGIVTTKNYQTGEYGYKKHGLHIIPMEWKNIKIELILTEKDYTSHAMMLDFTIGAQYFNLRTLDLHTIPGLNSYNDVLNKRLNTITDPQKSFTEDLSRIFRAIRLIADEGFVLYPACESAIKTLFSSDMNPFLTMNPDKLCHQLDILLKSPYPIKHLDILHKLKMLDKLFGFTPKHSHQNVLTRLSQLNAYCSNSYQLFDSSREYLGFPISTVYNDLRFFQYQRDPNLGSDTGLTESPKTQQSKR